MTTGISPLIRDFRTDCQKNIINLKLIEELTSVLAESSVQSAELLRTHYSREEVFTIFSTVLNISTIIHDRIKDNNLTEEEAISLAGLSTAITATLKEYRKLDKK